MSIQTNKMKKYLLFDDQYVYSSTIKKNRIRRRNSWSYTDNNSKDCCSNKITCLCYKCVEYRELEIFGELCSCCGKISKDVRKYKSTFNIRGSLLCNECSSYETCPSCGYDSAGSLCKFCRYE